MNIVGFWKEIVLLLAEVLADTFWNLTLIHVAQDVDQRQVPQGIGAAPHGWRKVCSVDNMRTGRIQPGETAVRRSCSACCKPDANYPGPHWVHMPGRVADDLKEATHKQASAPKWTQQEQASALSPPRTPPPLLHRRPIFTCQPPTGEVHVTPYLSGMKDAYINACQQHLLMLLRRLDMCSSCVLVSIRGVILNVISPGHCDNHAAPWPECTRHQMWSRRSHTCNCPAHAQHALASCRWTQCLGPRQLQLLLSPMGRWCPCRVASLQGHPRPPPPCPCVPTRLRVRHSVRRPKRPPHLCP